MDRRGFLGSILALAAAPAVVRADSLMRLASPEGFVLRDGVLVPNAWADAVRQIRAYDIHSDSMIYRLDVMTRGSDGALIQRGVDFRVAPGHDIVGSRAVAMQVLRQHVPAEERPLKGKLRIPSDVEGCYLSLTP